MTRSRQTILIALFSVFALIASAQPGPQPPNPNDDPDAVPITGLEYLLVGGGIYGVSRLLKNRKSKSDDV